MTNPRHPSFETLFVELGARRYPIHVGAGLLAQHDLLSSLTGDREVLLVSTPPVAALYQETVLAQAPHARTLLLPDGEEYKTLASAEMIFDALLAHGVGRDGLLLALGGGVIGDLAGFAAACYQRGVDFIQLPTTLLAQVDASVGGKTAVNHPRGKNMIGAFHQPRAVLADIATLATLDERNYRAGLAEVIKYGIIRDGTFFAWLEERLDALLGRDAASLHHAVLQSCRIKAEIVIADERETGIRALLNLGHTFGHAIETAAGYGNWLHGEAVAAGIACAARAAAAQDLLPPTDCARIVQLLERAGLPTRIPAVLDWPALRKLMQTDKKVQQRKLRLVLPDAIGSARLCDDVPDAILEAAVKHA